MNFLELPLFQSLSDQELEQMKTSGCLRTASYKKNDIIFSTGSTVSEIGIVLSGSVNVENIDLSAFLRHDKKYFIKYAKNS